MALSDVRSFSAVAIWSLAAFFVTACGPVYKTDYTYTPPKDASGRQCLNQCLALQSSCRSAAEDRAVRENAACQQNAMVNYSVCLATAKSDAERNRCSSYSYCDRKPDLRACDAEYRMCYQNCGGTVVGHQRCVSGC